LYRP